MDILTEEEQLHLLEALDYTWNPLTPPEQNQPAYHAIANAWKRARNLTAGLLMLDAGLRVSEVAKLRVIDCYFGNHPVQTLTICNIVAKGGHVRKIPLSARLRSVLSRFIPAHLLIADWPLTQTLISRTNQGRPLSARNIYRFIRRAGIQSLNRKIHPHVLRHTFATKLMHVTDIRTVQELLGHKHLTSTQIYTHVNDLDKRDAIRALEKKPTSPPLEQGGSVL